jgi:hypothetical protein
MDLVLFNPMTTSAVSGSRERLGAKLALTFLLVICTLWLQSAGIAVLVAWIRDAAEGNNPRMGPLRASALVVRFTTAVSFCTDWRFCCGLAFIGGFVYRRGTQ